eukprot:g72162.t1
MFGLLVLARAAPTVQISRQILHSPESTAARSNQLLFAKFCKKKENPPEINCNTRLFYWEDSHPMQSLSSSQKKAVLLVAAAAGVATAYGYYRYRQAQIRHSPPPPQEEEEGEEEEEIRSRREQEEHQRQEEQERMPQEEEERVGQEEEEARKRREQEERQRQEQEEEAGKRREEQERARQKSYKAKEWTCVRCTFLNGPNALACDICASLKPAAALASSTAETSEVGSAASNGEQWACPECTLLNGINAAACNVCLLPKPAAALAPVMAAAAVGPVDTKQTAVEPMAQQEDEEDEDEDEDEDEETAKAKELSLLCRAGEAKGQQFDQIQTEGEQWACVRCTYLNGSDVSACGVCASLKPAVAPVMRGKTLTRQAAAAAATPPTRPAPHEGKEASSPIPKLGLSVSLLLATYQRWEAAGLAADATTDDVVRDLVKPATADQKCSYVELLVRSQDPQDRAGVATATVFLSHAWKYTFKQVVEAIAARWPDEDNVRSQTFLWFDIFTVNQHQTSTVDSDFWFEAFRENVRTIGRTVLILSPWRNPVPLTRSWCLWEIFYTRLTKVSFEICLSPTEVKDFIHALVKDFDSILKSLSRIDVKKAEAGKKEDQKKILDLVEGMEGAHELNKVVLAAMRTWVVQVGRDTLQAIQAIQGQTDEDEARVDSMRTLLRDRIGVLLVDLGDLKGAEELFRHSLEAREKMLGPEHIHTLGSVGNLASLLCRKSKLAEAEPLIRRALQAREKKLGADHPNTLTVANNLGDLLQQQGKLLEAESLYRRVLQAREKKLGADHPDTVTSVNNLGDLLRKQGKLAAAEPLCRRALQAREKTLGAEHPQTVISLGNLGCLLEKQGKLAEAEPLHRRALEAMEKALGAELPNTLTSVNNLGMLMKKQGKLEEAEALYRRALQGKEKALGAEHPSTLISVFNLAYFLEEQSKLAEAEALYRRSVQGCEKTLGAEHPQTLTWVNNLARFLEEQGKLAEAELLKRRAQEAKNDAR